MQGSQERTSISDKSRISSGQPVQDLRNERFEILLNIGVVLIRGNA